MTERPIHYISKRDCTPADTWRVAEWCYEHGATEFTMQFVGDDASLEPFASEVEARLAPFARSESRRETTWEIGGGDWVAPVPLWSLNAQSIDVLRQILDNGLFTYDIGGASIEDVTLYRSGQVVLAVTTHEGEAQLRLDIGEQRAFDKLGIPTHPQGWWAR